MITDYTLYETDTGRIRQTGYGMVPDIPGTAAVLDAHGTSEQYVVDGQLVDRPQLAPSVDRSQIGASGVDVAIISGIPSGATIRWNETEQIADGSDIEFVTDIIGEHKLQITLWPYQDAEVTINAI